jgi:hypothetical protein
VTTWPPHVMVIVMESSALTTPVLGVMVYSLVPILARAEDDELDQYTAAIFALDDPVFLSVISVLFVELTL